MQKVFRLNPRKDVNQVSTDFLIRNVCNLFDLDRRETMMTMDVILNRDLHNNVLAI